VIPIVVAVVGIVAALDRVRPGVRNFAVRGIDVSHHQGEIDWEEVSAAGVSFAFIKSSEGRDHHDTRFVENWAAADRAGLARGAYHFFTFCSPGAAQADHFLQVVPPTTGALPPAVDVEFAGNCRSWTSLDDVRRELRIFLARIEAAWSRRPLLYITSESGDRIIAGHFDDHPIWIRNVLWRPHPEEPAWLFWQWSDDGELAGIRTAVDMNVYRGGPEDLAALTH
jgi:lysozyme